MTYLSVPPSHRGYFAPQSKKNRISRITERRCDRLRGSTRWLLIVYRNDGGGVERIHNLALRVFDLNSTGTAPLVPFLLHGNVVVFHGILNRLDHEIIPVAGPFDLLVLPRAFVLLTDGNVPRFRHCRT